MGGSGEALNKFDSGELPKKKPLAKKPEIGKKPALSSAAPKAAPPKPAAAAKGAPKIVEEDLGTGLSLEESVEKCQAFYDGAHISALDSTKWAEKQAALQGIQA